MRFVVSSGTGLVTWPEHGEGARKTLALVQELVKRRRPNIVIADHAGRPLTLAKLKALAAASPSGVG